MSKIKSNKVWIIKIGSSLITNRGTNIDKTLITSIAKQIKDLKEHNIDVILVSSGAIASGITAMKLTQRPKEIHKLQALASIGQMDLVHIYQKIFKNFTIQTSQILLTNDNLTNKARHENIYFTIRELLDFGVVPIVNENDTVSFDEIKFGDNDNLAALLSNLVLAAKFIILTDQKGLFDSNPAINPNAKLITKISKNDDRLSKFASSESSSVGTGGMLSKVMAAKISKCDTHILGASDNILLDLLAEKEVGTILK